MARTFLPFWSSASGKVWIFGSSDNPTSLHALCCSAVHLAHQHLIFCNMLQPPFARHTVQAWLLRGDATHAQQPQSPSRSACCKQRQRVSPASAVLPLDELCAHERSSRNSAHPFTFKLTRQNKEVGIACPAPPGPLAAAPLLFLSSLLHSDAHCVVWVRARDFIFPIA